jgi:hypothetical protein
LNEEKANNLNLEKVSEIIRLIALIGASCSSKIPESLVKTLRKSEKSVKSLSTTLGRHLTVKITAESISSNPADSLNLATF